MRSLKKGTLALLSVAALVAATGCGDLGVTNPNNPDVKRVLATPEDVIAIDEALRSLAAQYERKSQVVELRFFGGLSVEETAEVLQISQETVMRDWKFAKGWLLRELSRVSARKT